MLIIVKYENDIKEYKCNSFNEINNYDKVVYILCDFNKLISLQNFLIHC